MRPLGKRNLPCISPRMSICALTLLSVSACTVESPELPSYESEWLIPIGNMSWTIEELLEDSDDVVFGPDGSVSFAMAEDLGDGSLDEPIRVDVGEQSIQAQIGPVSLPAVSPVAFSYRLGDLYPPANALGGFSIPVPAFAFDITSPDEDLPGSTSATIASGSLDLQVTNGLPVPVGAASGPDQIVLELIDPATGTMFAGTVLTAPIAADESVSAPIDLAGVTLPDRVQVRVAGGSPGSGGNSVLIDPDASLAISVQPLNMVVSAAVASIEAQTFTDQTSLTVPSSVQVLTASIGSGILSIDLRNDLPIPADLTLDIPSVVTPGGTPFQRIIAVAPQSNAVTNIDFAGHELRHTGTTSQDIDVNLTVTSPGSAGQDVLVRATDEVSATVSSFTLEFDSVSGIIDEEIVDIPEENWDVDLPEELEEVELLRADLRWFLNSTLEMPLSADLTLEGTNADGVMVPVSVTVDLPASPGGQPTEHVIVFDESNSLLMPFLNNWPVSVVARGVARVGDGVTMGTVRVGDTVSARYEINTPLTAAISPRSIDIDPDALDLGEDVRDAIRDRLIDASLDITVISTLPLDARAWFGLDSASQNVHDAPEILLGPIDLPAASPLRDPDDPGVRQRSVVPLAEEQVSVLTQDSLFQGIRLELTGTDGTFVTIRSTDEIALEGFVRARLRVGGIDE